MKKIAFILVLFFFLLAIGDGVIQTSWAKKKIIALLQKNLETSGWSVQVENVKRAFPDIEIEGVTLSSPDFALKFGELKTGISFTRLWRKEIIFTNLKADDVHWEIKQGVEPTSDSTVPPSSFRLTLRNFSLTNATLFDGFIASVSGDFSIRQSKKKGIQIWVEGGLLPNNKNQFLHRDWEFSGKLSCLKNRDWMIEKVNVESDLSQITGSGLLTPQGKIKNAILNVQSSLLQADETMIAKFQLTGEENGLAIQTKYKVPSLLEGDISSFYADGKLTSTSLSHADFLKNKWEINAPFSFEKQFGISFSNVVIDSEILKAQGDVHINSEMNVSAQGTFNSGKVHEFFSKAYGEASGKFHWREEDKKTFLSFDAQIDDVYFESFFAKKITFYSDIEDPLSTFEGTAVCDIFDGKWRELSVQEATIETTKEGENWPFSFSAFGKWGHPLDLNANGFWRLKQDNFILSLQSVDGSFFNHPLLLQEPVSFTSSPETFHLGDFSIALSDATLSGMFLKEKNGANATLTIDSLPIDFLSLNPLDVDVGGSFNLAVTVQEKDKELSGSVKASLDRIEMRLLGEKEILTAQGTLDGTFDRNELKIQGSLRTHETPLASIDLKLPIHFELFPMRVAPYFHHQMQGHLFFDGKVEEVLDYFNLKNHRLEGVGTCDLSLTGTLENPHLYGKCTLHSGYYQNYYTGTELKNIEALFEAKKNALVLSAFKATDPQDKGTLYGKGNIDLLPKEQFPFAFNFSFSKVNLSTFDLVQTEGSGTIRIFGDLSGATAKGNIEVNESDISIPSHIPKEVPNLEVIYKNRKAPPFTFALPEKNPYPLRLDLKVDVKDHLFISGRGLESEWKGQFHVEGEQTNIATKGQIELIKGQFIFSGRAFKLTQGSLIFTGEANKAPLLNLAADLQVKDILITAHLDGPLNNPQITLQSSPPLQQGSIMSYLLFGEDLAEINSFQALQLANSIASLAGGEAPGVIEKTKDSLGIDQFEIISIPDGSPDGNEKIGIQVGKYITEGVLVSLSQGAENSSGNIRIEVELKGNLSLILESDQANEQKQGKFSLRWARTY